MLDKHEEIPSDTAEQCERVGALDKTYVSFISSSQKDVSNAARQVTRQISDPIESSDSNLNLIYVTFSLLNTFLNILSLYHK